MIIGISGKIGSGKDTVGKIIQFLSLQSNISISENWKTVVYWCIESLNQRYSINSDWEIRKFADKLKDIVCLLINCTRAQLEDQEFKNKSLGEDWIVYYGVNYKLSTNKFDGKVTGIYSNENELLEIKLVSNINFEIKKVELTPRLLLQLIGTECGRQIIHPNLWVNALFVDYKGEYISSGKSLNLAKELQQKWIITDTRFPNELEAIKSREGITLRVNRHFDWETKFREDLNNSLTDGVYTIGSGNFIAHTGKSGKIEYEVALKKELLKNSEHASENSLDDAEFDYVIDNDGTIEELIEKVKEFLITFKII